MSVSLKYAECHHALAGGEWMQSDNGTLNFRVGLVENRALTAYHLMGWKCSFCVSINVLLLYGPLGRPKFWLISRFDVSVADIRV